jgi:hypothetical protein
MEQGTELFSESIMRIHLIVAPVILLAALAAGELVVLPLIDETPPLSPKPVPDMVAVRVRALEQVLQKRREAIRRLFGGQSTLLETAAQFRDIAVDDPCDVLRLLRRLHPDVTTVDELYCRQVLSYIRSEALLDGFPIAVVIPWEQELERLKERGDLRLPKAAPHCAV